MILMEKYEDTDNSLLYIDDIDDELNSNQYNLKIIENYQNKNRNIEITNQLENDAPNKLFSPVAPLAEETDLSDSKLSDFQEQKKCKHEKRHPLKPAGLKFIIKGCNSIISIQGLDDKSSITFKRKSGRIHHSIVPDDQNERSEKSGLKMENCKNVEKPKKGRWKTLTRSLINKSARFERRGLDERYPKYVLLKNEEEVSYEKESYPKIIAFQGKKQKNVKEKENIETKTEFNFKKSFKNKTKPIVPLEEILAKSMIDDRKVIREKKRVSERSLCEKRNVLVNKTITIERRKSLEAENISTSKNPEMIFDPQGSISQNQVFNEIQGIVEDTLKLYPESRPIPAPQLDSSGGFPSIPPNFRQYFYPDSCCCFSPQNQPPTYVPVYPPYCKPRHSYKHSNTQTNESEFIVSTETLGKDSKPEPETDFHDLPFGILSNFFPRVVIMKTFQNSFDGEGIQGNEQEELGQNFHIFNTGDSKTCEKNGENDFKMPATLEVPRPDLTLKSSIATREAKPATASEMPTFFSEDFYVNCLTVNEVSSSDEDHKTKTDGSETTEYLNFCENELPDNESLKPVEISTTKGDLERKLEITEKGESSKNLSLTKIGYKMYDNLTKLSLNREKEIIEKPDTTGCGCNGNGTKKPPYNITLESNDRVVKVTVPENELNFEILNSDGADIRIGLSSSPKERDLERKKVVTKSELWHPDNGRKELVIAQNEKTLEAENLKKGLQKIKLSMADNKEVVLSIEMNEKIHEEEKPVKKLSKEIKIGTDDFDLAGGDFPCTFGSYKNLSPRTGRLLKNLQNKLELGEKERKFLSEKINEKLTDQKYQGGIFPGIFLVKQLSPRISSSKNLLKEPIQKPPKIVEGKNSVSQLREYYCEDCLATMRIFEDEIPSVKNMVDKFETIIQLEGY